MDSRRPAPSRGFCIEVGCPGCGGEVSLYRDFALLSCQHCGSAIRVVPPEAPPAYWVKVRKRPYEVRAHLDKHFRAHQYPLAGLGTPLSLVYAPYWKIDALALKVRSLSGESEQPDQDELETLERPERERSVAVLTQFSTTVPAFQSGAALPHSLGVRAGVVPMSPLTAGALDSTDTCLPISVLWDEAVAAAAKAAGSVGAMDMRWSLRPRTQLFRPRGSIVYFPFYLADVATSDGYCRFALSGLTGSVEARASLEQMAPVAEPAPGLEFGVLKIELHRCPNCGVDLPYYPSLVYQCHNCHQMQFLDHHPRLARTPLVAVSNEVDPGAFYPFWMVVIAPGGNNPRRYVVPAFEMRNAEAWYRLSCHLTAACSRMQTSSLEAPVSRAVAAYVSIESALAVLEAILSRRATESVILADKPGQLHSPASISILYVPFREHHYFMIDSVLNSVTFAKAGIARPPVASK